MKANSGNIDEKIKVGLYFGSFNPVHNGHINLANYLIDRNKVDEVWFVVSPCNPLKQQAGLIDHAVRFEMLELAIAGNDRLKVSDIEFDMPVPSYTIDTLHLLSKTYPDVDFVLVIGSDNALVFDKWKDYQQILAEYAIWVYPRSGYDFDIVRDKYPEMRRLDTPYYDISSTEIRDRIAKNKDVSPYLPPMVYRYILENKLYLS